MSSPSQTQRANSAPQPKSRLNYVLDAPLPTPPSFSALSLQDPPPHLPALHPPSHHSAPSLRARSADTALPPISSYPHTAPLPSSPHYSHPSSSAITTRSPSTSALSDALPERLPSGIRSSPVAAQAKEYASLNHPSLTPPSPSASRMPSPPAASSGKRHKTDSEIRDKRELRRMKNRISAARSRQRKTDSFETLQRELGEAKRVIEALTHQLDSARSETLRQGMVTIAVPHDLRRVFGRDYASADTLMDLLRYYIARDGGGGMAGPLGPSTREPGAD